MDRSPAENWRPKAAQKVKWVFRPNGLQRIDFCWASVSSYKKKERILSSGVYITIL